MTSGSLFIETRLEPVDQEAGFGGDFSDCFPVGDGRLAFVVGNVCGSGPEAAAHVPAVKFTLRAFLGEHHSPRIALALLNNLLCAQQDRLPDHARSVALALVLLDERTGEVEYATAGSEPPMIVRLDGDFEPGDTTGILLGVEPNYAYGSITRSLQPGDLVVAVTDGVTKAHLGHSLLGYYGMAYLAVTAQTTAPWEPREIAPHVAESILSGARSFAGGRFHNDACVMVIRCGEMTAQRDTRN